MAMFARKADNDGLDSEAVPPEAYYDKLNRRPLDLSRSREMGRSMRSIIAETSKSAQAAPMPTKSGKLTSISGATKVLASTIDELEDYGEDMQNVMTRVQRKILTGEMQGGDSRAASAVSTAGKQALDAFKARTNQDLSVARDAAIAETAARARRASVSMMEDDLTMSLAERRLYNTGASASKLARKASIQTDGGKGRRASAQTNIDSEVDSDDDAPNTALGGESVSAARLGTRSDVALSKLGVFGLGFRDSDNVRAGLRSDPAVYETVHGCHVLIVNLGVSKRQQFRQWAKTFGFKISLVTSGRDAIAVASKPDSQVDVLFGDLTEGASNIVDMLRQLRACNVLIPVILAIPPMGDIALDESILDALEACKELGVTATMEKPVAFEQLAVRVRILLERAQKVDELYKAIRSSKAVSDVSRHKSQHRKAFVEEQYRGAVESRPMSRSLLQRRPDSGYTPTMTARSGASNITAGELELDMTTVAALAIAEEHEKALAEQRWFAPAGTAESPRELAERAAAAATSWEQLDRPTESRQSRRTSFHDYRVPAPKIAPGAEKHEFEDAARAVPIANDIRPLTFRSPAKEYTTRMESARAGSLPAVRSSVRTPPPSDQSTQHTAVDKSASSRHHSQPLLRTFTAAPDAKESLDNQFVSPVRAAMIRKTRVLQPKDIAAAAAAAEAEAEAAASAQLQKKRQQAAEVANAKRAVLLGQADEAFGSEVLADGRVRRRGSVVAADILQLGRSSIANGVDHVEAMHAAAAQHMLKTEDQRETTSSTPWRPGGALTSMSAGERAARAADIHHRRKENTTAKSVEHMQRHMEAVRSHFIARAATLRDKERRGAAARVRKVENAQIKSRVVHEVKTALKRAATGEAFTDDHASTVNLMEAPKLWAPFDVLHGEPKEPANESLENLTKAHHLVRQGVGKREAGEDDAAIALYTRALRVDPRYVTSLLLRGAAYYRQWKFDAALADFNACIKANPRDGIARYNRALAQYSLGNWHDCVDDLNVCLELDAKDVDSLQLRGLVHRRLHQYDAAHHDYSSVMYANMASKRLTPGTTLKGVLKSSTSSSKLPNRSTSSMALKPSNSLPCLGGAASTHSIAGLSMGPEQTAEQLRSLLTGGDDLFGIVFEKPTDLQNALHVPPTRRSADEVRCINSALQHLIFFRALSEQQQLAFAKTCFRKVFNEGDTITNEGEPVRYLYIILSGECTVKVRVEGKAAATERSSHSPSVSADDEGSAQAPTAGATAISVDSYKTGDHFGHLSLLFGEQRTLTVMVKSPQAELILLPRTAFFRLGLDNTFIDDLEKRRDILTRCGAFNFLSEGDLLKLCCSAKYRQCRKHCPLITQGSLPREFMVLTKGIVHVYKASDALADVELRMKTLQEEINSLHQLFTYHYSLRELGGPVSVDEEYLLPADLANATATVDKPSDRQTAFAKLMHGGHGSAGSLSSVVRTLRDRGADIDDETRAAAEAGVVFNSDLQLTASAHYKPPRTEMLSPTFVETYAIELQKRLEALEKQRIQVLRQLGRTADGPAVDVAATAGAQYRVLVESLYPPCILSPLAITDPWHGFEQGDYVAETYVELLVISKTQIDHRMFSKPQLAEIQSKTTRFPRDAVVIERYKHDKEWDTYRTKVVDMIDKRRWPLDAHAARIQFTGNGRQLVVPLEHAKRN